MIALSFRFILSCLRINLNISWTFFCISRDIRERIISCSFAETRNVSPFAGRSSLQSHQTSQAIYNRLQRSEEFQLPRHSGVIIMA